MKKNLFTLVSVFATLALMLGACATPTTEAPKPTSAPAATAAPAQPTAVPKPTEVKITNPPTT
ncbi:MAG: peptide ABC transporter substrate-binding protein, partial [Chloroflexi bacterium]|nr:peptide ABC transporter substrate-binding protein [Chloroflexota bacterium]